MRPKLSPIPEPQPDPATWPSRGVRSFIMNADYFDPVCRKGDKLYVTRCNQVRAIGGDYIMATRTGGAVSYVIVHIERPTGSTWNGMIYGSRGGPGSGHYRTKVRLSRKKWRLAYRVRSIVFARHDERSRVKQGQP